MPQLKEHITYANIIQTLIAAGVVGILVQIGVYKERFESLSRAVIELSQTLDVHAADNRAEFTRINNAVIEYTGKPVK